MPQEIAKKHSLWLNSPNLQPVVNELAKETGNPIFVPHLTLIGNYVGTGSETMMLVQNIASRFKAQLTIDFAGFGTKDEEFRYFCLLAKPNSELDRLYEYVHQAFKLATQETFRQWPHISLLYGTQSARETYPDIEELAARYEDSLDGPLSFTKITALDTSGDVATWSTIGAVTLSA